MSEEKFWKTTPRKLNSLLKIHHDINKDKNSNSKEEENKPMFIDQIPL